MGTGYEKALQDIPPNLLGTPFHDTDVITHPCLKRGSPDFVETGQVYDFPTPTC
jgi:hypothetical protein